MKKQMFIVMISLLIISLTMPSAHSQLVQFASTFDNSNDGWTIDGNGIGGTVPNYYSAGGNPGGFIESVEATGNAVWFFVSPNSWNGNWTNFIGGSLRFDFKSFEETGPGSVNTVRIYSGSNFVAWDFSITPPLGEWTRFEVELTASNFDRISGTPGTTFEGIMTNVTALWIRGDYGANDRGGLDNVRITSTESNPSRIGVFRASTGMWYLDVNANGAWNGCGTDGCIHFGMSGDLPVAGDWNNDGFSEVGVFRPNTGMWYVDLNGNDQWSGCGGDGCHHFGMEGDLPVAGDWNNGGPAKIGVFRPSTGMWYLDYNGNGQWDGCGTDSCIHFGMSGDQPVSGDWNGSGSGKVGVFRPSTSMWYLDYNGNGQWDGCQIDWCISFGMGMDEFQPVVGDWDGTRFSKVGAFRSSTGMW
jgi:hypothetical protein